MHYAVINISNSSMLHCCQMTSLQKKGTKAVSVVVPFQRVALLINGAYEHVKAYINVQNIIFSKDSDSFCAFFSENGHV